MLANGVDHSEDEGWDPIMEKLRTLGCMAGAREAPSLYKRDCLSSLKVFYLPSSHHLIITSPKQLQKAVSSRSPTSTQTLDHPVPFLKPTTNHPPTTAKMLLTTTLTTLTTLLLTTLSTALPTTKETRQTGCASVHPPSPPYLYLANRPNLNLTRTQTLTFTLSNNNTVPGPGPCTLRAVFPPNWNILDTSVQAGGQPLAVNVYAVGGPAPGALVGTSRFAAAPGGYVGAGGNRVVVVNSFACRATMAYRFELAGVGELGFLNGFDRRRMRGGLEMAVGC
ncbi:hypothetical protein B0I37DRAFT_385212 [Chaetomium sp. MPI-CAGE-AT-0009]|nr:hypothetical protein B0I37DRAFT_385212 [Chaetomium sp. MPI-CAGE-AT-0009]